MTTREQVRRYPGASPFQDRELDRRAFFGRDRESRSLYHLVKAEQLVVLFAKSGVGKTSLINAGLLEPLRRRGYFPMVVRVNDLERGPIGSCLDGVRHAARRARVDCVNGDGSDLRGFFAAAEFWSEGQDLLRPVLILDQFEELFTLYPASPRREFSRQFAELIRDLPGPAERAGAPGGRASAAGAAPRPKVVLSLREDYLAGLEDLARETPAVLHNRFRLNPLSRAEARSAIVEPARLEDEAFRSTPFSYSEEAVQAILDFLARRRWGAETIETDEVEPFQLQLICHEAEKQAEKKRSAERPAAIEISADDLGGVGRMRQILGRFYRRAVATVRSLRARRSVRKLCERRLISGSGRRLTEEEEEIQRRYRLSKEQLRQLVDARLLRAEARLGGTFYELSHDTLIKPILESRKRRRRWQWSVAGLLVAILLATGAFLLSAQAQEAKEVAEEAAGEAVETRETLTEEMGWLSQDPSRLLRSWVAGYGYADGWRVDRHPRMMADVDGDGRDDVVGFHDDGVYVSTSTGSGFSTPEPWVAAYAHADHTGAWRVDRHPRMMADVDGDGRDDVVGFHDDGVHVSTSTGSGFSSPRRWVDAYGSDDDAGAWSVENHPRLMADVDGDGTDDVVGFHDDGVWVSTSTGSGFSDPGRWVDAYGYDDDAGSWRVERHPRLMADVDGDGTDDVVGFHDDGVYVSTSTGTGFSTPGRWVGAYDYDAGWRVEQHPRLMADADGDGTHDVVGFHDDGVWVSTSTGSGFSTPELWVGGFGADDDAWSVEDHLRLMADVDGDGTDDVVGFHDVGVYVSTSTGTGFSTPELWVGDYGYDTGWQVDRHPRLMADVNGDGRDDVVGFRNAGVYVFLAPLLGPDIPPPPPEPTPPAVECEAVLTLDRPEIDGFKVTLSGSPSADEGHRGIWARLAGGTRTAVSWGDGSAVELRKSLPATHDYTQGGRFEIQVFTADAQGNCTVQTQVVELSDPPPPPPDAPDAVPLCDEVEVKQGETVTLESLGLNLHLGNPHEGYAERIAVSTVEGGESLLYLEELRERGRALFPEENPTCLLYLGATKDRVIKRDFATFLVCCWGP